MSTDNDAFIQAETGSGNIDLFTTNGERDYESLRTPSSVQQDGENVAKRTRHSGLYSIVRAPTRELCGQISAVLSTLIHCKNGPHRIVPGAVSGGEKNKSEKAWLREGINILVATPARPLDRLENTESLDVS